jgi:uncharacterized protein (TIGR00369 family)
LDNEGAGFTGKPLAADVEAKVRASFASQGLMTLLGVEIAELSAGRCVLSLPYRPDLSQQQGFFHGAAIGAIADVAGGYASCSLAPLESEVLTVEYKLSLYAAASGTRIEAVGEVLRPGRLTTCLIDIYDVQADGTRCRCATALQTITLTP